MPNLATQPRTTRRAHRGSRGPARWIASEGGPEANRRATLPVAVRAVQRSTVLDHAAVLRERARIVSVTRSYNTHRRLHDCLIIGEEATLLVSDRELRRAGVSQATGLQLGQAEVPSEAAIN
jgi:hypothetical protein